MKSDGREKAPKHIGIIMDGNGRWATKRLLPRVAGHRAGVKNIIPIVAAAIDGGAECVSLYAFSTENEGRPKDEVDALVDLIRKRLPPMAEELAEHDAHIFVSGDLSYFPSDVREIVKDVSERHADLKKTVNIALNYGGRNEIVRAAALAAAEGEVTPASFEKNLYTYGLPDLDMIVRTGGEKRLSNFLLYQAAYSELFFTDTLWPDFSPSELDGMLEEYSRRTRRFGKI